MLLRMVRPVRRNDSRFPYFSQRIPRDLLPRAAGLKLALPIGDETVAVTLSRSAKVVQVSLRTADPGEAKVRNAALGAYVETVWRALRNDMPLPLTHRQATALAGELYRAWAFGEGRERTASVTIDRATSKPIEDDGVNADSEPAFWEATRVNLDRIQAADDECRDGDRSARPLERAFGTLVDRVLRGCGRVLDSCQDRWGDPRRRKHVVRLSNG